MTTEQLISLCGLLLGSGSAVTIALQKLIERVGTRGKRRRDDLEKAFGLYDKECARRRVMEEHASLLRRMLIEAPCVAPDELPAWPGSKHNNSKGGE